MNDLLILTLLLDEPKYGYQLRREAGWIMGQEALHNNIVYPLLRRFLEQKWVTKKSLPGERGQTRQQYALTAEGRRYVFQRITEFGESDAASENAFYLRVGLFELLKPEEREKILTNREQYLARRDQKLAALAQHMDLGKFGSEIVRYMRQQIEMELQWAGRLRRMAKLSERRKHENAMA
jgi:DNA-binding PadR family transcriptional regulator